MSRSVDAVAARAWAVPDPIARPDSPDSPEEDEDRGGGSAKPRGSGAGYVDPGPSGWQLIFDTETRTDLGQQIRLLTWQERYAGRLRRTGIAYNPAELTAAEIALVEEYADAERLRCMTVEDWIHKVFFNIAWAKRGTVIGFNLPFDLSRLAIGHDTARAPRQSPAMRGGWTFQLSANDRLPWVQIKKINGRAAFIRLALRSGRSPEARNREQGGNVANHHGYFVDVATIGAAMLGRRMSLKLAAELLQTDTRKADDGGAHGGPLTKEYLDYAVTDTQVTWECHATLTDRYAGYRLDTPLDKIYSEASIGKAHLRQMGLRPWREVQPDVPDAIIATIMETYYGGRTETRIRRTPMPGVATDVTAEYPTVFVLQGLWRFLTAEHVDWVEEDPAVVLGQLKTLTVDRLLDRAFWPELHRLVQVAPEGDLLPTRAPFAGGSTLNLALAHRDGGPAQWFTYADVLAGWLTTGRLPTILRVLRFTAGQAQPGLRPIDLMGRRDFRIDPYTDDLVQRAGELRHQIRTSPAVGDAAEASAAIDAQQQGMKIISNSTGYGVTIEVNTLEHRRPQPVTVHLPDGATYASRSTRTEVPGSYFHPLVGTLVAGGGRLLLALVMRLVADRGGSYVFCDTDSLFIVTTETGGLVPCLGGSHRLPDGREAVRALIWAEVRDVADELGRLNPYQGPLGDEPLLKIEKENFDPRTREQVQLHCHSIASKRYAPLRYDAQGRPGLVGTPGKYKRSEHGLGHLLDPTDPDPAHPQDGFRDQWWLRLLHQEHGLLVTDPDWFDRPAVGRLSVSSKQEDASFASHNASLPYERQTRPFNFGMMAFPKPGQAITGALVAPLETDSALWEQVDWYQRGDKHATPLTIRTGDPTYSIPGTVVVQSYRDVFNEYLQHPEAKAAGPEGQPCLPGTRGLLQPLSVAPTVIVRIGKETNRHAAIDDLADGSDDLPVVYAQAERSCASCSGPLRGRQQRWCGEACRKRVERRQP